jgi:uncharacterized small protein (DUF1192 family)
VPELVATPDRKTLSPMDIVAVLTRVVQEQERRLAALQDEVASLRAAETAWAGTEARPYDFLRSCRSSSALRFRPQR